jgi:hypothetical protein
MNAGSVAVIFSFMIFQSPNILCCNSCDDSIGDGSYLVSVIAESFENATAFDLKIYPAGPINVMPEVWNDTVQLYLLVVSHRERQDFLDTVLNDRAVISMHAEVM